MGSRSRSRERVYRGRRSMIAISVSRKGAKQQVSVVYEPIPEKMNARKCQHQSRQEGCADMATRMRFSVGTGGRIDKSSRVFRCDKHK